MAAAALWGAPAGDVAYQQMADQRQDTANRTLTAQTGALETMGRIAAQPGERALREAQAQDAQAQAEGRAYELKQKQIAQQRLIDYSAQRGQVATVGQVPVAGAPKPQTELEQYADWYEKQPGSDPAVSGKIRGQIAEIAQKNASADFDTARAAGSRVVTASGENAAMVKELTVALSSPEAYAKSFPRLNGKGSPLEGQLSGNYAQDYPRINRFAMGSIDKAKQRELEMQAAENKSQAALRNAQGLQAKQAVAASKANVIRLDAREKALISAGGSGTAAAEAAKLATAEAKAQAADAANLLANPAVPLDPKQYVERQTYTVTTGIHRGALVWFVKDPTYRDGNGVLRGWRPEQVRAAPPVRPLVPTAAQITAARTAAIAEVTNAYPLIRDED